MTFTIPNLLSILRMGLVPVFVVALVDGEPKRALAIFLIAGLTDALDGTIARLAHQQSVLGTYLDPIADKLLLTTAYIVLAIPGLNPALPVPIWVTALVIGRDVLIIVVSISLYLALGQKTFLPSPIGKLTTGFQIATVLLVLLVGISTRPAVHATALFAIYATAFLTVASGLSYIVRANRASRPAPG